jgi:hypothetical protein
VHGDNLDKEAIVDVAKSTARTGDSVSAKVQGLGESKSTWKHMNRSNFVCVTVAANEEFNKVIDEIYSVYREIESED